MKTTISKVDNADGSIDLYFENLGHWDYLELIKNILVNDNKCLVIGEFDMITDKEILLKFTDVQFMLKHDYMFGNCLHITDKHDYVILEHLANNVIENISADTP